MTRGSLAPAAMRLLALWAVSEAASWQAEKSDGTCGYQCAAGAADATCGGCGRAGRCSCPDGGNVSFHEIGCTCVSAPSDAPSESKSPVDVADSAWPLQWTASVDAWCYGDFSNTTSFAQGKFFYDATLGKTRADWTPYINGKNCTQVWIADVSGGQPSSYYVKTGPLCISFSITDPGAGGMMVGVEKADWMKSCKDAGFARYVGREQVDVEGAPVWADHWSCRLDYEAANQTIVFQNWHSLGLDGVPKGLPLRVTGGNSAPNPTKGSPRLNTVWYKDFKTGPGATTPKDFEKPNWGICIPVGADEAEAFFGHALTKEHVWSPDFRERAHFLPHAKPGAADLRRARQPKPGRAFVGESFRHAMQKLNRILLNDKGLQVQPCHDMSLKQVHSARRLLFHARSPELHGVYHEANDTRRMPHSTVAQLDAEHADHAGIASEAPEFEDKLRDGACHEAVMWYVHHLSAAAREEVKARLVLPLLPEVPHEPPPRAASAAARPAQFGQLGAPGGSNTDEAPPETSPRDELGRRVHSRYEEQVSCAICHVAPSAAPWETSQPAALVV